MKAIVTIVCLCTFTTVWGQNDPHVYFPDGTKYSGSHHALEQINEDLEEKGRVYHYTPFVNQGDEITTVGFVLFTDSALWVLTHNPALIDSAINHFDVEEFYNSPEFKIELDAFIGNGTLPDDFIMKTWGEPLKKRTFITKEGELHRWYYNNHGVDLIFKDGVVVHHLPHGVT